MHRFARLITTRAFTPLARPLIRPALPLPSQRAFSWAGIRLEQHSHDNEDDLEEIDPKEYPELYPEGDEDGEIDTEWFVDPEFSDEANASGTDFIPLWQRQALQERGPLEQASKALMESGKFTPDSIKLLLEESKMDNVEILDLRGKCDWTDYMIIADTSKGERYLSTVGEHLSQVVRKAIQSNPDAQAAQSFPHIEGRDDNSGWMLIDLGRSIVHLFTPEKRKLYDLEGLWKAVPEASPDL